MKKYIIILLPIILVLSTIYILYNINLSNNYILVSRIEKIITLIIVSFILGYTTIVFQTITGNKILTPSLMGYEQLYVLVQVLILLLFGVNNIFFQSKIIIFIITSSILIAYSIFLYYFMFKVFNKQIYLLLLVGLVLSIFFYTITQFFQIIVDPNEFNYIQNVMFSNLNRVNTNSILLAIIVMIVIICYGSRFLKYLNIIGLGREYAISLGVNYDRVIKNQLFIISILVSISTALIGPITFVGIFISSITYQISKTSNIIINIILAMGLSFFLLIISQFIIEQLLNQTYSFGIIINLLGGGYFLVLMIIKNKKIV